MERNEEAMRRHLRLMNVRNNPIQNLVSFIMVACIFLFFQASIMKNLQRTQMMLLNSGSEAHNKMKYKNIAPNFVPPQRVHPRFKNKFHKEIGIKVNGTLLRGVKKDRRKLYLPDDHFKFNCLDGNGSISFNFVNNDFCDCNDGSDEPGTSACKNGRFYCEPELRYLPSSRVNDGICDCCDGSDEWKGTTVPPDLELPDEVQRAPCSDTCQDYLHEKIHDENLKREGVSMKNEIINKYKEEISTLEYQGINTEIYGKDGKFYYLSKECYFHKSPGYVYEVCPYHNVSQISEDTWLIGSGPGKLEVDELTGQQQLVMDGGQGDHCPDGMNRKTIILFECSNSETEVHYVSEKSTCVYQVKLRTPVVCNVEENIEESPQ